MKENRYKIYNKICNNWNIIRIFIFVAIFIFSASFLPKIGNNFDTYSERSILLANIKDYNKIFKYNGLTEKLSDIKEISNNIEKDHGISPYYILTPVVLNLPLYKVIDIWHMYTFILFYLSVIFMYKLIKYLYKKENVAMLTIILYTFSPRIFIDAFHNNKDIVLMSFLVIMIYYGIKLIIEKKIKYLLLFGIISGIVCNIKIIGLFFLFIIGLGYIINIIKTKSFNKKNFFIGLLALILSLGGWIILTPAIWASNQSIFSFINYCLKNSMDFRIHHSVFFEGSYIYSLPWYYLLKNMFITLPLVVDFLFIMSIFLIIIHIFKKEKNTSYFYLIIPLAIFVITNLIFIFFKPYIYNTWRHCYFLYGLIIMISSYMIYHLINNKNKIIKFSSLFLIFISIFYNLYCLKKYDVANTAYYNILVQKNGIENRYELDYYGVTTKTAILDFLKSTDIKYNSYGKIYIYGNGMNYWAIGNILYNSNETITENFELLNDMEFAELSRTEPIYIFNNTTANRNFDVSQFKLVYSYKWFDFHIIDIYLS